MISCLRRKRQKLNVGSAGGVPILLAVAACACAAAAAAAPGPRPDVDVPARLAAVDSLLASGRAEPALTELNRLATDWADDPLFGAQIADRRGQALLVAGRPAEALPWLEKSVARNPLQAGAHRNLALALARLGRRGRALAEYTQAVELAPLDAEHRLEHAQYLAEFGQWDRAAAEFRVAAELCGGCPAAARGLGVSLLELDRAGEAVEPLARAQTVEPDSAGRSFLVAALYAARRDSALLALLDAEDRAAWTRQDYLAHAEAEGRLGREAERSAAYVEALAAGNAPGPVDGDALFWGRVALTLLKADRPEEGLRAVDRAVELDPQNVVYRNNRVVLLTRLGRHEEAAREWERVLALDPSRKDGAGP